MLPLDPYLSQDLQLLVPVGRSGSRGAAHLRTALARSRRWYACHGIPACRRLWSCTGVAVQDSLSISLFANGPNRP